LKKQRAIRAEGAGGATGAPTGSANLPPTSETWTSLGELPASHVVPLPARSVATVVLQGRLR